MAAFLIRRATTSAALIVVLTIVTFLIYFAVPASPGRIFFGAGANPTAEQIAEVERAMGVDRPMHVQYLDYIWGLVRGDFGESWNGAEITPEGELIGAPVRDVVFDSARVTGSILIGGAVLLVGMAIPLGILAATRPNSLTDKLVLAFALLGLSTHPVALGLVLRYVFANQLGVAPPLGYCPFFADPAQPFVPNEINPTETCGGPADWATHLILPWFTFALFFMALYVRMIRGRMLDVLGEPYMRTARAKGASEARVLSRHGLRNMMSPVLTMIGMDIGYALSIAIFVEAVFDLPGLARQTIFALSGLSGYDLPMILGVVVFTAVVVVVLNLLVDIVCAIIDPRIRESGRRALAVPAGVR